MSTMSTHGRPGDDQSMSGLTSERIAATVDRAARAGFAGVVRVDAGNSILHESAHGLADRGHIIPNTVDTRYAAASALKGCTALTVMSLVQSGLLALDTRVVSILDEATSFVDPVVTVHHLLSHRSGLGEYCEEIDASQGIDPDAAAPKSPPCALDCPSSILTVMDGVTARSEPGAEFRYNNAGYAVLALLAECVTGTSFAELVERRVFAPAGMAMSGVLRYDELSGDVAVGYRERTGLRTNVHAVPNQGIGDGGLFTTAADMVLFWQALEAGALVDPDLVETMTRPHGCTRRGTPYGLGFWLDPTTDAITLEGYDTGISFRSVHRPSTAITWTVASNWTDGAWPLADELALLTDVEST